MQPDGRHRSRIMRPWRRLRRWMRHTPNGQIAFTMATIGIALMVLAAVLAFTIL